MSTTTDTLAPAFIIEGNQVHIPAWEVSLPLPPLCSPAKTSKLRAAALCGDMMAYRAATQRRGELFGAPCEVTRIYEQDTLAAMDGFGILFDGGVGVLFSEQHAGECWYSVRVPGTPPLHRTTEEGAATMAEVLPLVMRLAHGEEVPHDDAMGG